MLASPSRNERPPTQAAAASSPRSRSASTGSVLRPTSSHNESGASSSSSSQQRPSSSGQRPQSSGRMSPLKGLRKGNKSSSKIDVTQLAAPPPRTKEQIDNEFEQLLSRLEVSRNIRSKLLALATPVKEDFLRRESDLTASSFGFFGAGAGPSSTASTSDELAPPDKRALFGGGGGGRSRSSSSLDLGGGGGPASRVASGQSYHSHSSSTSSTSPGKKQKTKQSPTLPASNGIFDNNDRTPRARGRTKSASGNALRSLSPSRAGASTSASSSNSAAVHAHHLLTTPSRHLSIPTLKSLRVLLSSESPTWLGDFLFTSRGYEGLLKRIGELVEMEWREDIHDDKALHELLRGMSALSQTDRGLVALSSQLFRPYVAQLPAGGAAAAAASTGALLPETAPASFIGKEDTPPELPVGWELHPPFGPLVALLLSEKKPGELKTRKLLVDVLGSLLDLRFPGALQQQPQQQQQADGATVDLLSSLREKREISPCYEALLTSTPSASPLHLLLLLLHNPLQPRSLSLLPFISLSHTPRPFKSYLLELLSVARDYFWVFCHSDNRFWDWGALQGEGEGREERRRRGAEGPSVPGGMTDGVEWEAMRYLETNIGLINRIATELIGSSAEPAKLFHHALFDSGMERLLQTLRRASTKYYPRTHLAMAEYLALAERSGYRVPAGVKMRCEGGALRVEWELPEVPRRTEGVGVVQGVREAEPERRASPTRVAAVAPQQMQLQQMPNEHHSSPPALFTAAAAAAVAAPQAPAASTSSTFSPTRSPALRRSPSPSRRSPSPSRRKRNVIVVDEQQPTAAGMPKSISSKTRDWFVPSSTAAIATAPRPSAASSSHLSNATEDLAAATAFLTTSASEEAFFSQPVERVKGEKREKERERGVGSSADAYAYARADGGVAGRKEEKAKATGKGKEAPPPSSTLGTLGSMELGASAAALAPPAAPFSRTTAAAPGASSGSASASGHGFFSRAPPGSSIVAVGTARDRIKLWEGRVKDAGSAGGSAGGGGRR